MPKPKSSSDFRVKAAVKSFRRRSPVRHSKAFLMGLRAVLAARYRLPVVYCNPFRQGSARFDAFRAGCQQGNFIYLPGASSSRTLKWDRT